MVTAPAPALEGPPRLPGLDPTWSRMVTAADAEGRLRSWHVLDSGGEATAGTLLCVHGNPTWSYLWRRLVAAAPPGWRVVAPDHLGMGYSERLAEPRTLAERVDDLSGLTAAMGLTGPVVTVGHDWGGAISLGWALAHRDQLRGVVLGNTAVAQPPGDRGPALIRLAHVPFVREAACVRTSLFVRSAATLSRPALAPDVRRALAAPYGSAARRRSVGGFVADIPFAEGHPSRSAVQAIADGIRTLDVPVLLLWGPRDPVFGEKYLADLRERLPQAELHRYEGASHLVTEDAPEYAEAVAQWLTDAATGRPRGGRRAAAGPRSGAEDPTLWSALVRRADDLSPAIVEVGGSTVSWAALDRRVRDLAAGMAAAGVRPGQRIGLLLEPSPDLTAAVYAAWLAGAVVVVADKGLGFGGMRRALRSAAVDHVIGGAPGLAAARLMGLPGGRFAAGGVPARLRRVLGAEHSLDELVSRGRREPAPPEPSPDQDCAVVFTSGATGPAKGVVYCHCQVLSQLELLRSTYAVSKEDRLVAAFAPFSLLGPALGIGSVVPDIDVTAPETLTAAALADAASAVEATIVFASPAALRRVAATTAGLSAAQLDALGGIRLLMSAGAPVPAALLQSLTTILPAAELHTPYGMTEVLPVTDIALDGILQAGAGEGVCVGRPLSSVEVGVSPLSATSTADDPPAVQPDRTGEICVRAAHVKDRYADLWATERASSRDAGWHRTGDVGHLDPQGRLWVEGRMAHVITTADGPVTPVGVEQRVESLPEVQSAVAVGVGPPGAQVLAVVVVPARAAPRRRRRPRTSLADVSLTEAVRAAAGTPVAAVLTTTELPVDIRHASKVDRREVAARASRVLAGANRP